MKTLNKIKYLIIILLAFFTISSFAQSGPGDPGGDPGGGGDPIGGGGAPLNGQVIVLFSLALAYGGMKVYQFTRLKPKEEPE